jgi:hypothetical protein
MVCRFGVLCLSLEAGVLEMKAALKQKQDEAEALRVQLYEISR